MFHNLFGLLLLLFIEASYASTPGRCADLIPARLSRQTSREATILQQAGFNAEQIPALVQFPRLVTLLERHLKNPNAGADPYYASIIGHFEEGDIRLSSPQVVTVYRGISLENLADYDPNYGLFIEQNGRLAGAIDVAEDKDVAIRYARQRMQDDRPVGLLLVLRVPALILSTGRFDGAYKIGSDLWETFGIRDIMPFIVRIERLE